MLVHYLTYCLHFIFANYIDVLCSIIVLIHLIRNLANNTKRDGHFSPLKFIQIIINSVSVRFC